MTVNVEDTVPWSVGLVTVTVPAPVDAPPATLMLAVSWVELFQVVEFTVIPALLNVAAASEAILVPVITIF